jgi:tRNA U34 5-methylaminomethyl-2-thiouridine-forming methyltransferase MnmC
LQIVKSNDGTNTAYSSQYDEHYHSLNDGALNETLNKHIIPSFEYIKNKYEVNILDICFGLGYNSLATIYFYNLKNFDGKINIYSPELDLKLIKSLENFEYPKEFIDQQNIINSISRNLSYEDNKIKIKVFNQDAREVIKNIDVKFDIIYQDAFSYKKNHLLWTKEYFEDIKKLCKDDAVLTTYSQSTYVRMGLFENGFYLYDNISQKTRHGTLAFLKPQDTLSPIDMNKKIKNNPNAKSLRDEEVQN